jgi:hypothetical protein
MATKVEGEPFEIHVVGNVTGKTWDGKFRAKAVLTFREQMQADKMRREFTGPDVTDPDIAAQAIILSDLFYRLTDAPEWWRANANGMDLSDPNVLKEVFEGAKKVESDYLEKVKAEAEKARGVVTAELEKPPTK